MKTILCIADFSLVSENAVNYAYELAQLLQSRLLLFHNVIAPATSAPDAQTGNSHSEADTGSGGSNAYIAKLEEIKKRLQFNNPAADVPCDYMLQHGLAKNTIPTLVQEEQVELVVIGNEDAEVLQDIFAGTVAGDIIRRTPCPVLVIPQHASFKPLRKIVYAVDQLGEPYQDAGLVLRLAHIFDSEILVLHVLPEASASARATAQEEVYPLATWRSHRHVTYHILLNNSIEEGISQFSRENRVDMLVLGYHAENPWQHLRNQNASHQEVYHTYLPVLFTHFKKEGQT